MSEGLTNKSCSLHEMTHLLQMKGTLDYGVYGYEALKTLPGQENMNHADTYCLFANGKLAKTLSILYNTVIADSFLSSRQSRQGLLENGVPTEASQYGRQVQATVEGKK